MKIDMHLQSCFLLFVEKFVTILNLWSAKSYPVAMATKLMNTSKLIILIISLIIISLPLNGDINTHSHFDSFWTRKK